MSITKSNLRVQHDLLGKVIFIKVKSGNAELHYQRHGDQYIEVISTRVPREARGFGIGSALAEAAIDFAKEQDLKIKPSCEFMTIFFQKHNEYKSLLKPND